MYTKIDGTRVNVVRFQPTLQQKVERLIQLFEARLEEAVRSFKILPRYVRPLAPGSVICGHNRGRFYVGYHPQLGAPTTQFLELQIQGSGYPSPLNFLDFLRDRTALEFCVVELREEWLNLSSVELASAIDAVVKQVIHSELSRVQEQSPVVPSTPIFGPNRFPIQDTLVFVLMPFEERLTEIYNTVVKPIVESKNLICRRADEISSNNVIMHDVWKSICEARLVIADLTMRNPNVMYELGIAHTVGKETILIHQGDDSKLFPFDISHFRIINYPDSVIGGTQLRTRLGSVLDSVLQKISTA